MPSYSSGRWELYLGPNAFPRNILPTELFFHPLAILCIYLTKGWYCLQGSSLSFSRHVTAVSILGAYLKIIVEMKSFTSVLPVTTLPPSLFFSTVPAPLSMLPSLHAFFLPSLQAFPDLCLPPRSSSWPACCVHQPEGGLTFSCFILIVYNL